MAAEVITKEDAQLMSTAVFEKLDSGNPTLMKEAADAVNDFTRTKMREDGFYRRMIPMVPVQNSDFVRQVDTEKLVIIVDKEPDSPAAISIPFATNPSSLYIKGNRYPVMFDRITTPKFTKDVDELRTWIMDIRQVLSDNAIKDMLAEEDGKFLRAFNTAIVGAGMVVPTSGTVQYEEIPGGITRDSLWDGLKVMPNTPSSLEVHVMLMNNITVKEVGKFTHNEFGGTTSEDIMKNGISFTRLMGKDCLVTIKKGLVPTNTVYQMADPKFVGKSFSAEDTTMYIKREAWWLEFFAYALLGGALGHTSGLARLDYK